MYLHLIDISTIFVSMKKDTQLSQIEKTVFYSIEKTIKTYRQFAQKNIKQNGIDITIDQWLILKTIHDHPKISQREIAATVFKDHASVTRMIELLVKRQFLIRSFHEEDRRRYSLSLTNEGKKIFKKLIPIVSHNRSTALAGIQIEDIEHLHKTLNTISNNCFNYST